MAKIAQEIVTIKFTKVISSSDVATFATASDIKTSMSGIVSGLFGPDTIVEVTNTANVTIVGNSVAVTNATGTGDIATLSFETQTDAPFVSGQKIVVTNVTPVEYNGTFNVITCSNASVTVLSTATGNTDFANTIGTITEVA